jgi:iron complex outermembrane recepter protein
MRFILLYTLLLSATICSHAQNEDTTALPEVVVRAFEQNRRQKEVAAPTHVIGRSMLERFAPFSVLQAVNTAPGIRMEERSPGSYRINIRGSSLRSPFGVRNVKVYFNDLPITDPGGQTYLNALGYYNFGSVEIIRGPGSSLYGGGTGGVLLIEDRPLPEANGLSGSYTHGSFGTQQLYASGQFAAQQIVSRISFQHLQSDGYRNHSGLNKNVFTWTTKADWKTNTQLRTTLLFSELFYQTPGALTKQEWEAAPRAARPRSGAFPAATEAQAAVKLQQLLAGFSITHQLSPKLRNKTVGYALLSKLQNPNLRNYDENNEPHGGGRTTFTYTHKFAHSSLELTSGAELQAGSPSVQVYKNLGGRADSLRSQEQQRNRQTLLFLQAQWETKHWIITAGGGWNKATVSVQRFQPATAGLQRRNFDNGIAPRFALLRKFNAVNVYVSVGRGFSPPTTAELLPTGGNINLDLNAESGWNYELGMKGTWFRRLYADVHLFHFSLRNTIVQRRNAGGGDYFINAGGTSQWGAETYLSLPLFTTSSRLQNSLLWLSHTYHHFHYQSFKQLDEDYSGKRLPGTPIQALSAGVDLSARSGWMVGINYYHAGSIPLNDANTAFAPAYHLLGTRFAYRKSWKSLKLQLSIGAENLLNQTYSLGNDLNAFGGRYYNAAASRNYFASIVAEWNQKRR